MVGAGIDHPTFDINRMILNELTVTGSFVYDLGGFERALELLASDGFPADLLIDPDDVTLDGITDALEGLAQGRIAGKVMVVPEVRALMGTPLLPLWQPALQPRRHVTAGRSPRRGEPRPTSAGSSTRYSASTR